MNRTLPSTLQCVLIVLLCSLTTSSLSAQTTAVSIIAGTVSTANNSGSTGSWANTANVQIEDDVFATATITGANKSTNYLDATNWGFQTTNSSAANYIPSNATINGVQVQVKRRRTLKGSARDVKVILLKSGAETGVSRAVTTAWPTTNAFAAYGNEIDLWGATLTAADIINSGFGLRIAVRNKGKKTVQAEIDYIKITVFFNQTIFYSKSTGNLETLTTWGTGTSGTGTAPLNFTRDGQIFILKNRTSASLTAPLTISGTNSTLIVGDGSAATTLTIPSTFAYTGRLSVKDNSSLIITNTTTPTLTSVGSNTTVTYNATANQTIADVNYYNLTLNGSGTKSFTSNAAALTAVENSLSIGGSVTANNQGNAIIVTGSGISNNGSAIGSGSYVYTLLDANGTLSGNGKYSNLEIDAGSSNSSPSTITLSSPTTVTESLYLTDGILSNGSSLTLASGSVIKVEDGNLGTTLSSSGYDVTYLPNSNSTTSTGNEITGTVRNMDVQVGSSATLSLNKNLTLTGNLTVSSGTLDASTSNYNLTVGGNLTNSGTLNLRSNTVTLNGSSTQIIGGGSTQTFYKLAIANAAGGSVQLNEPVVVNNSLALTNGIVNTSAANSLTMGASATFTGGSSNSYINGPMKATASSINATKTFPLGKNGAYRPITLAVTQTTTASTLYTAEVVAAAPSTLALTTGLQTISSVRYYTLSSSNAANLSSATIDLSYNADEQVINPAVLRVAKSNGAQWQNLGGSGTTMPGGTITSGAFTSLGDFVLANVNIVALPLTWISFDAVKKSSAIELNWQTAQEINTKDFVIEKSTDGQTWNAIGTLASNNRAGLNTYTFTDAVPSTVNYYRLKQVDIDEKFAYSKTLRVSFTLSTIDLVVYPTVVRSGSVKCVIRDQELLKTERVSVSVYDFAGRLVVSNKMKPQANVILDCSNLSAGQYTILVSNGSKKQQAKVLVQ